MQIGMKTMCIFIVLVEHTEFERAEKQPQLLQT